MSRPLERMGNDVVDAEREKIQREAVFSAISEPNGLFKPFLYDMNEFLSTDNMTEVNKQKRVMIR